MKHSEFIARMEQYRLIYEYWSNECQDLTQVAKKFGLAKAVVASNIIDYFRRHDGDYAYPALGHLDHDFVTQLLHWHRPSRLREEMIEHYSKSTPLHARATRRWAMRHREKLAQVFDALGLEHITVDGVEYVHWKYSEPSYAKSTEAIH